MTRNYMINIIICVAVTTLMLVGNIWLASLTGGVVLLHFLGCWIAALAAAFLLPNTFVRVVSVGVIASVYGFIPSPNYWLPLGCGDWLRALENLDYIAGSLFSVVGFASLFFLTASITISSMKLLVHR